MTCSICGKPEWHGSQESNAFPGSHLSETGCHLGFRIDDDEFAEGVQKKVIYPPCPNNPKKCTACNGNGFVVTVENDGSHCDDECGFCDGHGWETPQKFLSDLISEETRCPDTPDMFGDAA